MILMFVLLWFSMLCGMEREMPPLEERSPVLSLKEIALCTVCNYLVDKKILIDDIRQKLNKDCQTLIESASSEKPILVKHDAGSNNFLYRITPNHRYALMEDKQAKDIKRLDLWTGKTTVVDDSKGHILQKAISPSGNLVVLRSSEKLWIKDIAQNKIIIEEPTNLKIEYFEFIGEHGLFGMPNNLSSETYFTIENKLKEQREIEGKCIAILHTTQEYITFKEGVFSRIALDGKVKNSTTIKNPIRLPGKPPFYEPEMLIAYLTYVKNKINQRYIEIVSLKDWPSVVTPSAHLPFENKPLSLSEINFAHKGQWLLVAQESSIKIWDWKNNQLIWLYNKIERGELFHIFRYTDACVHYPFLFASSNAIYSFDPIKIVAAGMLSQVVSQKSAVTSNDNNSNNNNNNVSNDNRPALTTSIEQIK